MFQRHGKVLLDVKGLIMHSYHRCNDKDSTLLNEDNERVTRATAAFETFLTSYLIDIFKEHAPVDVIAAWDGGNQRRKGLFPDYKLKRSQRKKEPVEGEQLDRLYKMVKDFLAGMGCIQVSVPGVEADDLIAYLSRGIKPYTIVHTVDNDLTQLANETCLVMVHYKTEVKTEAVYVDDKGNEVPAHLVALYKSLIGDTSDEYPGVKGVGAVAWTNLVAAYDLDGMEELDALARKQDANGLQAIAKELNDKTINKIAESPYRWFVQYELARLHPEWCEGAYQNKLVKPQWFKRLPNTERARHPVEQAGCLDLWHHFEKYLPVTKLVDATNVDSLLYESDFLDDLNLRPASFDYESYDPNEFQNFIDVTASSANKYVDVLSQRMTGASFCWGANYQKSVYISCDHAGTANVPKSVVADFLIACEYKIVHNAAFEQTVTVTEFGEDFMREYLHAPIDTTILSSYVDENEPSGLKESSLTWLRYNQTSYSSLLKEFGAANMKELTGGQTLHYGADDSIVAAHLWILWDVICMVEGTDEFLYENEFLTNQVFASSFRRGCRIDERRLNKMKTEDQAELDKLWPELRTLLSDNCREQNEEAAQTYHEDTKGFTIAKMQQDGKSEDEIHAKLASDLERFRAATVYTPYKEEIKHFEFKPTKTQIANTLHRLRVPPVVKDADNQEEVEAYYPASMAGSRITEWLTGLHAMQDSDEVVTEEVMKFAGLVAQAAHQFKKREGEEYEALRQYVEEMFADKAKTVASGDELNFDSPVQMAQIIYGKLALPIRHRSKVDPGSKRDELGFAGGPATNDKAVEMALAEDCRSEDDWRRKVLLTIRAIKKLQTKFKFYYNSYPLWVHPLDGRIHPQVKNCGTVTRRPSGTSPNILQVAKGPIRSMYLPVEPGHVLVAPDFSGQELRILASESLDEVLLDAYLGEVQKDVHSLTGSAIMPRIARKNYPHLMEHMKMMTGKDAQSYEQFQAWRESDQFGEDTNFVRNKRAKGVNFLVNYEGGAGTLSTNLLVPKEEAQEFIDGMFELYPGIPVFQEESHKLAQKHGYVQTAYGNRRHMLESILSRDNGERMRMERQASNFRIQGCAADILKVVVAECERSGLLRETGAVIMAPVYDELVCSVPTEQLVYFCQSLQKIMDVTPPGHKVPMVSEFSLGFDWHNMVETGTDTSAERLMEALSEAVKLANDVEAQLVEWEKATGEAA